MFVDLKFILVEQHGYKDAHELKADFVGLEGSKFNMYINKSTGEIILKSLNGKITVPTGLW